MRGGIQPFTTAGASIGVTFYAQILVFGSSFNVGSTTPGNVGNTVTIAANGPADAFLVSYSVVGIVPGGLVNFVALGLDGGPINDAVRTHSPSVNSFFTVSRTDVVTGLTAGTHTLGLRSWNNTGGTATIVGADSTITVVKIR